MDKDLFKKKLGELAKIKQHVDSTDTRVQEIEGHPLLILKFKDQHYECEDCGKICKARPKRNHVKKPDYWHESCTECRRVRSPTTGKMVFFNQINAKSAKTKNPPPQLD